MLVTQDKCRAWRMCISGCPYKKVYYNWSTGKSEKCILCYPRLEAGRRRRASTPASAASATWASCSTTRTASSTAAARPDDELVEAQRGMILDPDDPDVSGAEARRQHRAHDRGGAAIPGLQAGEGVGARAAAPSRVPHAADALLRAAAAAVAHRRRGGGLLRRWRERAFRSAISPASSPRATRARWRPRSAGSRGPGLAVRARRGRRSGRLGRQCLAVAGLTAAQADAIFRLTTLASMSERIVVPPLGREDQTDTNAEPQPHRGAGFGFLRPMEGR